MPDRKYVGKKLKFMESLFKVTMNNKIIFCYPKPINTNNSEVWILIILLLGMMDSNIHV